MKRRVQINDNAIKRYVESRNKYQADAKPLLEEMERNNEELKAVSERVRVDNANLKDRLVKIAGVVDKQKKTIQTKLQAIEKKEQLHPYEYVSRFDFDKDSGTLFVELTDALIEATETIKNKMDQDRKENS